MGSEEKKKSQEGELLVKERANEKDYSGLKGNHDKFKNKFQESERRRERRSRVSSKPVGSEYNLYRPCDRECLEKRSGMVKKATHLNLKGTRQEDEKEKPWRRNPSSTLLPSQEKDNNRKHNPKERK